MTLVETLCQEFKLAPWQVEAVISLLDEGNTLPFIARYRKEAHGSLDDTVLRELSERLASLRNLQARREEISSSLKKLEKWGGQTRRRSLNWPRRPDSAPTP